MGRLRDTLESGGFVVTGEVAPPLGTDLSATLDAARTMASVCHAVNVTDNQGASLHMASLAASRALLDDGIEPVFQQTCRDRNRLALQSDLLAAWAMGLENLLVVTGDDPRGGDHPAAKGVFDIDSTQLLQIATGMNGGHDMLGRPLDGGTGFYLGAAVFPEAEPWEVQEARAIEKAAAGATFFQTQAVFEPEKLARAAEALHAVGAKVIAGVLLLRSPRVIDFVNEHLAGMMVPEPVAERIRGAADPKGEAIALATETVAAAREVCDGVHIMPLGLYDAVERIAREAGVA